jgi:hypothetical protein
MAETQWFLPDISAEMQKPGKGMGNMEGLHGLTGNGEKPGNGGFGFTFLSIGYKN